MSSSTSNPNPENKTSNTDAIKDNLSYIEKFGLPAGVAQHIDSRLILNDVHIDDPTTALDIELNSWVLNCLESYQLDSNLVVYVLTGLRAGRFTRPTSKPAGAQIGLADTVDFWASKSE